MNFLGVLMKNTKKGLLIFTLIASLLSAVLYLALSAAYALTVSNILYLSGVLPVIIEVFVWLFGLLSYGVIFSLLIYSVFLFGAKGALPQALIHCAILLFIKNLANTVIQSWILGIHTTFPDLLLPLANALLDIALVFVVILIAHVKQKKGRKTTDRTAALRPTAFLVAIIISATKLVSRIVYDLGYGAPSDLNDLLNMLIGYTSDLSIIAIIFLVSHLTFKYLKRGDLK